ncbi:MAG: InlB B-repeat-containing protein [Firmicutes bacterium]|nr:InlB B-repeat-containing protein [Bacillota bacterium]
MGNGVFSYDSNTNTLYINGNYSYKYSEVIDSSVPDLTVNVISDSELSSNDTCISLSAATTIKGAGKLTLKSGRGSGLCIYDYSGDVSVTIKDMSMDINAYRYGILNNAASLCIDNSDVTIKIPYFTKYTAALGGDQASTLEFKNCTVTYPESYRITDGTLYSTSETIPANEVTIERKGYTVSFNPNGGSGTMKNVLADRSADYVLPECTFTAPTNTSFYKWRINGELHDAGEEIEISEYTVLYATWYVKEVRKEVTAPTIGATPVNTVQNYSYTVNGETVTLNDYSTVLTSSYDTTNTFEANKAYEITVHLSINGDEYYYSDDTKYYINGELAMLDNAKSSIKTAYLTYTFPRLTYGGLKYDTDNSVFEVDGTIKLDDYVCASVAEDISEKSDSAMESYLAGDYHYEWYAGNDLLYTGTSDTDTSFKVPKSASGRNIYAVLIVGDQTAQSEEVAIPTYYCTVSFNGNGQTVNINSQNIGYGSFVSEPQNPEIEGYIFGGWFTDANCNNKFDFTAPITADTELYAKWTAFYNVGDADGNGKVTATDAAIVFEYVVSGYKSVLPIKDKYADYISIIDMDGDKIITANDSALILEKARKFDGEIQQK